VAGELGAALEGALGAELEGALGAELGDASGDVFAAPVFVLPVFVLLVLLLHPEPSNAKHNARAIIKASSLNVFFIFSSLIIYAGSTPGIALLPY